MNKLIDKIKSFFRNLFKKRSSVLLPVLRKNSLQEFTISKNGTEDLTFSRLQDNSLPIGYVPIPMSELSQQNVANAFSTIIGASGQAALLSNAANGLYQATASASQLMQYSNGTLSSIVQAGGKIQGHSGFVPVNASVFTPMIIFQLASIVTGQYYMHGISKQLEQINEAVKQIQKDLEFEKQAKLIAAYEALLSFASARTNTIDELVQIQNHINLINEIKHFYLIKIKDSNSKDLLLKQFKKKVSWGDFNSEKAWNITCHFLEESEEQKYNTQMCIDAYKLLCIAKMVYLKAAASICFSRPEYSSKALDCIKELENETKGLIKDIFDSHQERIQLIREYCQDKKDDAIIWFKIFDDDMVFELINEKEKDNKNCLVSISQEIDSILQPIRQKQTILLEIKGDKAELYRQFN